MSQKPINVPADSDLAISWSSISSFEATDAPPDCYVYQCL